MLPHPGSGWGYPFPGPGRGVPHHRLRWVGGSQSQFQVGGGYSIPGPDGGTPGTPHPDWMGYPSPHPGLDDVSQSMTGWGTPSPGLDGVPPSPHCQETEQHSEHLLRGRRFTSCIHAEGLSCLLFLFLVLNNNCQLMFNTRYPVTSDKMTNRLQWYQLSFK